MFQNVLILLIIVAIAGLVFWLLRKVWRRQNKLAKWGGSAGLGFLGALVTLIAILGALGMWTIYAPRGNEVLARTVDPTPQLVGRGAVLASAMCAGCHSVDQELPLAGNTNLLADIPMPLGDVWPPNLTPAGRINEWSDGELQRAIREGTYPNGHRMPIMSSQTFRYLSQLDLDAIVAYLRSQPAMEDDLGEPKHQLSFLAMALTTLGMLPLKDQPDSNVPPAAVAIGPTAEYGAYIAAVADCVLCHGDTLDGGTSTIVPNGPSLKHVAGWTTEGFLTMMRTGVTPAGTTLDPDEMPWESYGKLDDESLTALLEYLKTQ